MRSFALEWNIDKSKWCKRANRNSRWKRSNTISICWSSGRKKGNGGVTASDLNNEFTTNGRTDVTDVSGENPITVEFISGRKYDIDNNGIITENNKVIGDESWYTWEEVENGIRIIGFNDEIQEFKMQHFQEISEFEDPESAMLALQTVSEEIETKYPGIGNIPAQINGKNVTEIGENAFMLMPVKELTIPNTVTNIQPWAFIMGGAKEVIIPSSVKTIGASAFQMSILEKLTFAGDVKIGVRAFDVSYNLEKVIFISSNVTFGEKIDDGNIGIFDSCPKLVENTIQIPQGSRQNFENYTLTQWGLSSYNAFYEK